MEQEREERERMQVLVSNFTEGQLDRYEMFRRAAFPKASIKRVMQQITGEHQIYSLPGLFIVFVFSVCVPCGHELSTSSIQVINYYTYFLNGLKVSFNYGLFSSASSTVPVKVPKCVLMCALMCCFRFAQ